MVYGKIFEQIYDGTLRSDPMVRLVFMDMIVLADQNGVLDITQEAFAARTNIPIETVIKSIKVLEAQDSRSRSREFDGARIKLLDEHRDWGWQLVNYMTYRDKGSKQDRKEQNKVNKQKQRDRESAFVSVRQRSSAMSAHTDTDTDKSF